MSLYKIELLKVAEIELEEAFNYYNDQQTGLGLRFFKEISRYLDSIADNPYKFAEKYENLFHFAPLKIFPFPIAYWVDAQTRTVFVTSIFHTSRNPRKFEDFNL